MYFCTCDDNRAVSVIILSFRLVPTKCSVSVHFRLVGMGGVQPYVKQLSFSESNCAFLGCDDDLVTPRTSSRRAHPNRARSVSAKRRLIYAFCLLSSQRALLFEIVVIAVNLIYSKINHILCRIITLLIRHCYLCLFYLYLRSVTACVAADIS